MNTSQPGETMPEDDLPLSGIRVLDLSTLLPGPMATLMLAQAGADVVKLERQGSGDEMRSYTPKLGAASANYAVLNRGKRAYGVDLKDPTHRDHVLRLAAEADVVVEQFRPGVADRLGLGYADVAALREDVIYCSISGYGPEGPRAKRAGHDLNYLGDSGLLGVTRGSDGTPSLPVTVIADIAGGTYPAVVNILLALRRRDRTGRGCHLAISMTHNLQVMAYGYIATHQAGGGWPTPGEELLTGGSPRYHVYTTMDGRHIACAALEQKFWDRLTDLVGLPDRLRLDEGREHEVIDALAEIFAGRTAEQWSSVLEGEDVCTSVVATWEEAVDAGLVHVEGSETVSDPSGDAGFPTLWSPVAPTLRTAPGDVPYPELEDLPTLGRASAWRT